MNKFKYKLVDSFTSEKTKDTLLTRRNSIIGNSPIGELSPTNQKNIRHIDIILKDYILDYDSNESWEVPYRQIETRNSWNEAFKTDHIEYNKALCVILGVNPSASDLLEQDLYQINNIAEIFDKPLSYIFYNRHENTLLKNKFSRRHRIKTNEFILWATSSKVKIIKQILLPDINSKRRHQSIKNQEKINPIARRIVLYSPSISKSELSEYVSDTLEREHEIQLKPSAIYKRYLVMHPIY
jgi:hypothetical protein